VEDLAQMLDICDRYHENRTFSFREITTSVTNKRTNKQTSLITMPPAVAAVKITESWNGE